MRFDTKYLPLWLQNMQQMDELLTAESKEHAMYFVKRKASALLPKHFQQAALHTCDFLII